MAIIKLNQPHAAMRDRFFPSAFTSLMDQLISENPRTDKSGFFNPATDISETTGSYELSLVLPGMKKEDIRIDLDNEVMTVSGERKLEKEEEGKTILRIESHYGSFSRSFNLPDSVKKEEINARFTDGILHISLPKAEKSLPKQINIV